MTSISSTAANELLSESAGNQRTASKNSLSKDDFMKIFLAQMRMQSPTNPYDSSVMLQQMSQLTSLSATEELQSAVKNLNNNINKSQILYASPMIGRSIQVPSDISPLTEGKGLSGSVVFSPGMGDATITIKDKSGTVVATIKKTAPAGGGVVDFDWDGKDSSGNTLKPDFYQISATASFNGSEAALPTAGTFKVGSVTVNPTTGGIIMNVDGLGGIGMDSVVKIL